MNLFLDLIQIIDLKLEVIYPTQLMIPKEQLQKPLKKDRALEDVKVVDAKGKAILDEDGNRLITKGLKSVYIESIKQQANSSLAPSDWLVTRFVEDNTKKIPDDVKTYRKKVRDTSDSIITKIEAIKN